MPNKIYDSGMTPVNKTAARVVSKGTEFTPKLKPSNIVEQRTPFPVRELREIPISIRHLIGYRFGRMTVIGFSHLPSRWSVRCACGTYCLRTTKAITNPNNINDACRECRALLRHQRHNHFLSTGKDIDTESLPMASQTRPPLPQPVTSGPRYTARKIKPSEAKPTPEPVPLHWTEQQRGNPTIMAAALEAAATKKPGKSR